MMIKRIRKTGYSSCISAGPFFFKITNPCASRSAENEYKVNQKLRSYEINTFHVLFSLFLSKKFVFVMRNYSRLITPLTDEYHLGNPNYHKIEECISKIESLPLENTEFWESFFVPEIANALTYLEKVNINSLRYLSILKSLVPETAIHGDFSCDNLALIRGQIYVYDWQLACKGPRGWDEAYYIASSTNPDRICSQLLQSKPKSLQQLILLCSAVRLGRSIRKNGEHEERLRILQRWEDALLL